MLFKKVTRRWLINGLGAVVALLVVIEFAAAFLVRSYYYQQAQNSLYTRAVSLSDMMSLYVNDADFDFEESAKTYMEDFTERNKMEFQVLDVAGNILASSTGFSPQSDVPLDYQSAVSNANLDSKSAWGVWNGKNAVGQNVLALTMLVRKSNDTVCGAIRYVVALDNVDKQITLITSAMITLGIALLFLIMLISSYFVNSILRPLSEIGEAATKIAQGEYSHRISKQYDDEIGDLCDTINDMAAQIESSGKLQNEFISSISHELRTPLTAIKGWSETLKGGGLEDPELLDRGLDIIGSETERLSGIVEELLDFSRMQQAKPSEVSEKIDVYAEVQDAVFLLNDRAKKQGITLTCTEQEALPAICGNGDRLRQVFVNIIDNAIKYAKPNGSIHVDAAPVTGGVQIVVSDNGIGISEADLPLVTERFYRASNSQPGSGIGLAVAKDIVNAHGGTLLIESELDKGTVVTVTLPTKR
ncbi:MAG: HAMP domain-containing histidine kinase [Clostridia bacterium]|nr:HAMP domain-containing histidine kinase [Clostridia bacterium]MBQ7038572.1 HAMP domain-containing histidine kinase [Clostridia bacterium]